MEVNSKFPLKKAVVEALSTVHLRCISLPGGCLCVEPRQRRGTLLLLQGICAAPQLRPQVVHRTYCGIQLLHSPAALPCSCLCGTSSQSHAVTQARLANILHKQPR
jgi:hypothetical protein